jgi:ankyrin repeat protein
MTAQFLKSVAIGDLVKASSILNEYGKELSLESRDKTGKTLLMVACQSGFDEIVKMLILAGSSTTGV